MNEKYRNYGLWVSITSLIPLMCEGYGLNILPTNYKEIIAILLGLLVALGVLSNPKEGKGYLDDNPTKSTKSTDITNEMR